MVDGDGRADRGQRRGRKVTPRTRRIVVRRDCRAGARGATRTRSCPLASCASRMAVGPGSLSI
jgi:phage tail tape-measure protein